MQIISKHIGALYLLAHTSTKVCIEHALMYKHTYLIRRGVYVLENTAEPTMMEKNNNKKNTLI